MAELAHDQEALGLILESPNFLKSYSKLDALRKRIENKDNLGYDAF